MKHKLKLHEIILITLALITYILVSDWEYEELCNSGNGFNRAYHSSC